MEAIRLSLAAEEDRKKKDEKDARKDAKKRAKEEKKEAKSAEKAARKGSGSTPQQLYRAETNDSSSTWASTSMARSTSNLGMHASIPEEQTTTQGKGKAPVQDFTGFSPTSEPSSTLSSEIRTEDGLMLSPGTSSDQAQRHLEESRALLQPTSATPIPTPGRASPLSHARQLSSASSVTSSFADSSPGSLRESGLESSNLPSAAASGLDVNSMVGASQGGDLSSGTPPPPPAATPQSLNANEPMLNFRSLAAMVGDEDKNDGVDEHIEDTRTEIDEEQLKEPCPAGTPNRSRGDSGESSSSAPPPIYVSDDNDDQITPAPRQPVLIHDDDKKEMRRVDVDVVREVGQ